MSQWPKLSDTLHPVHKLSACQMCASPLASADRWMEHDDSDQPTGIVILLCEECADLIIEDHPRLYRNMHRHEPHPGSMPTCDLCRFRTGLNCLHPNLKGNGGPGLELKFPQPTVAFIDGERGGVRFGSQQVFYSGAVVCKAKENQNGNS